MSAWVCSAADLRPQHGGSVAATAPQPICQKGADSLPQGPLWKNHRMFLCDSAWTNYYGETDILITSFGTEVSELWWWWLCSHYYVLCRLFPVLPFMSTHLKLLLLIRVICLAHKAFSFRSSPYCAESYPIMHTERADPFVSRWDDLSTLLPQSSYLGVPCAKPTPQHVPGPQLWRHQALPWCSSWKISKF